VAERFDPRELAGLPPELALSRLPTGRHGLPRAVVAEQQRLRLIASMLRALPQHGYAGLTIAHLVSGADVSRAAFYERFKDKEDCFLATFNLCASWFCEKVEGAVVEVTDWRDRVRIGAAEALRLLAANPLVAHLFAIEALRAGQAARERQQALLERFAAALRADHPGRPDLPEDLADLLLGGVVSLLARYVEEGRAEQLPEATRVLVEYLLIPYLGGEEASAAAAELPGA
jgi:AcrR family transcriptional regulator